jgi:predicted O-methyltransferase YrrM
MNLNILLDRLQIPRTFLATIASLSALWWLIVSSFSRRNNNTGVFAGIAIGLFVVGSMLTEIIFRFSHLNRKNISNHRQLQALLGLYAELDPEHSLPLLGEMALLPFTALNYVKVIRQTKPEIVVELGSGVSTLLSSLQLKQNGSGKVIAIDHEQKWVQRTINDLRQHGMEDWSEIRHAQLTPVEHNGRTVRWYDPAMLQDIEKIDVLLVDGPPDYVDSGQRQPGLSLLSDKFHDNTVILVDDTSRSNWNQWVHQWADNNDFIAEELYHDVEGGILLYKQQSNFFVLREGA